MLIFALFSAVGCSSGGRTVPGSSAAPPQSINGSGPYNPNSSAALATTRLPNVAGGAIDSALQSLATSGTTRSKQSYSLPNDMEQLGVTINPGGYYSAIFSYLAVYPTYKIPIAYPAGSKDTSAIYESLTSNNGGCLGNFITYINSGSGTQGIYSVYNYCGSSPGIVFETPIDSNFISNYTSTDSDGIPVVGTEVMTRDLTPKPTSVWYSIIDGKSGPEVVAQATGVLSSRTTGFALWTSELQPQPCPNIPAMGTGLVELWDNQRNTWNQVTAQMTATTSTLTSPSSSYGCFNPQTTLGRITEYAITNSTTGYQNSTEPSGITEGPDGNMWFAESSGSAAKNIGKMTPSGSMSVYPLPTVNEFPMSITTGKDGNLWFTVYSTDGLRVDKMTTSGSITEYLLPSGSANGDFDRGIAAGPDGNIWVTEYDANKIAKVTPSGTITEYEVPTSASGPDGITAGPDGNLWFTEYASNKIAKITTSGAVTEYALSGSAAQPFWITAGPDGNLWFTEQNGNAVGKITTNGVATLYPVPTKNAIVSQIAPGSDGNLWFTEYSPNQIGKITPSGTITEYPAPSLQSYAFTLKDANWHWLISPTNIKNSPYGMAMGPNGTVWFTDIDANRIGKISL